MKRDNRFGVWQRCRACGTIFPGKTELQEHLATHPRKPVENTEPEYTLDEPQPQFPQPRNRPFFARHQTFTQYK